MSKLVLFNKPFQVLSQFKRLDDKKSLKDFLSGEALADCYPAGRLDYDSEGLLLLTDNGQLQNRIAHPDKKLEKSYWVQVEGIAEAQDLIPLIQGIDLKDGPCKPAKVKIIAEPSIGPRHPPIRMRVNDQTTWLEITITEGRNRQVRRMTAAIGFPCLRLVRFKIGTWALESLAPGEYKIIDVNLPINSANISSSKKTSSNNPSSNNAYSNKSAKKALSPSKKNSTSRNAPKDKKYVKVKKP